jgi:hypothetical protein
MTPAEWIVALAGAALIAFELWFFLGKTSGGGKAS